MPRYIEFTTPTSEQMTAFTGGNPYHDGIILPGRFDVTGIRVDGQEVDFVDEAIPNKLHRALYETDRLSQRGVVIDCLAFTALMAGENLSVLPYGSGTRFLDVDPESQRHTTEDGPSDDPLYLLDNDAKNPRFVHAIHPAHRRERENYLHKLNLGPVIMSDLGAAMALYDSPGAVKMPEVTYGIKTYE